MKNPIRHFLSVFVVAGTVSFVAEPALAEIVTYNFTGTITSVTNPPPFGLIVNVGDPVKGSIAYDPSLSPVQNIDNVYARYIQPSPPGGMSVVIAGVAFPSSGISQLFQLFVSNNYMGVDGFSGRYEWFGTNMQFGFSDTSMTVFSSTALPPSLDIKKFNLSSGHISQGFGGSGEIYFSFETLSSTTPVKIDIKPGSFPNSINPHNEGVIPVVILTTGPSDNFTTFDAATVDPATIRFGPMGTEAAPVHEALEDIDRDGDIDLILHFNTQDTGIKCVDTSATLTGSTFDEQKIKGTDSIETVGCE